MADEPMKDRWSGRYARLGGLLAGMLLLAATGCGGAGDVPGADLPAGVAAPDSSVPSSESLDIPDRDLLFTGMLRLRPSSREEVLDAYGEPDRTTSQTVPNRHVPGETDTLVALHYPDAIVSFHIPGPGGELLSSVEVVDNRYLEYGLIGSSIGQVEREIGAADEVGDSVAKYLCRSCIAGDDPVTLVVKGGEIVRVRFDYYVD